MQETGEISDAQPIREGGDKDVAEIISGYTFPWRPFHTIKIQQLFRSPFARRLLSAMLAFLILVPLILILFRPGTTDAAWYSDTWRFRKLLTVNSAKVPSTQTDFPVLVSITDAGLKSHAQGTGNDILFTSSDGSTKLSHEIETFATGSGKLNAWVKIPSLSATTDTKIYLYYGNPSAPSQQDATNVWDSNFKGVWHFKENPGTTCSGTNEFCDSTSNAIQGNAEGGIVASQQTAGQINGGLYLDGVDDRVRTANFDVGAINTLTYSAWVKNDSTTTTTEGIFYHQDAMALFVNASGQIVVWIENSSAWHAAVTSSAYTDWNTWHHVAAVYNGSNVILYRDGVQVAISGSETGNFIAGVKQQTIGHETGSSYWQGIIDEPRISLTNRSADWIKTEYNNQSDPSSFLSVGQQAENKNAPVAWYKFDEGQGTVANNSGTCGKSCDGTLSGMASPAVYNSGWTEHGKYNKALAFDGTDDYVNAGSDSSINNLSKYSVSAWFKTDSIPGPGVYPHIVSQRDTTVNIWGLYLDGDEGGRVCLIHQYSSSPEAFACASEIPKTNTWYHIVATLDDSGNDTPKLYINGVEPLTYYTQTAGSGTMNHDTTIPIAIGNRINGGRPFDGLIDDIRIYDSVLGQDQIKVIYNEGAAAVLGHDTSDPLNQGLMGYWKMDETSWNGTCTGTPVTDSSGNANHGNACDGATTSGGKFGYGGTFDGTNDYVGITDNSVFDLSTTGKYTWSAWVKPTSFKEWNTLWSQHDTSSPNNQFVIYAHTSTSQEYGPVTAGISASWTSDPNYLRTHSTNNVLTTSGFYHILVTYNGSLSRENRITIYVNGINVTDTSDVASSGTVSNIAPGLIRIADDGWGDYGEMTVDDMRVYNRALSPSEAARLYDWGPGPAGHWKFDERKGTSAFDISGNNNTGTLVDGPKFSEGKFGSGMKFGAGNSGRIHIPDASTNDYIGGDMTLSTWAYIHNTEADRAFLISKPFNSSGRYNYILNYNDKDNCSGNTFAIFLMLSNPTTYKLCSSVVTKGVWHHVAVTLTSDKSVKIYVDGVLNTSGTHTITTWTPDVGGDQSDELTLGHTYPYNPGQPEGTNNGLDGKLDDVRIYNYALTQKQITSVMNADHPAVGSPVGSALTHYKFDEGYGTKANNSGSAGSTINGTLTGMASPATATSGWTDQGKFGKALSFDKTDDYVNAGSDQAIDNITEKTVCAWIYPRSIGELNGSFNFGEIVSKIGTEGWAFEIANQDGGQQGLYFWQDFSTGDGYWRTPNNKGPTLNAWNHVCVTHNNSSSANDPTFYINGVSPGVVEYSSPSGNAADDSAANLLIGNLADTSQTFDGLIDEVKIYNYILSADEIKTEYNQGKAQVLGSLSTDPDGMTGSNSAARAYCPPGDTATCNPPVGHWTLDERKGTSAFDISGNNNTGTLTGGPQWTTGKVGQALKFDGVDDSVNVGSPAVLDNLAPLTYAAWINPDTVGENNGGVILGKDNTDTTLRLIATNNLEFNVKYDGGNLTVTAGSNKITMGKWQQVVVTWDGSPDASGVGMYIDGIPITPGFSSNGSGTRIDDSAEDFFIGNRSDGTRTFDGLLDDVRVYNYARTPAQIAWEYNQGKPVAHYKLDECTGTRAYDSSGNNLHGTLNIAASGSNTSAGNCATVDTATAWYNGRNGKYNASLSFDGTDDYVSTSFGNSVKGLSQTSVSLWFKPSVLNGTSQVLYAEPTNDGTVGRIKINIDTNNKLLFTGRLDGGGISTFVADTRSLSANSWYHVVGVFDETTDTTHLYLNGEDLEDDFPGLGPYTNTTPASVPRIGSDTDNSSYFNGLIDDVRVYNYALNPTQIRTVLNEGAAIRFGPLTGSP